MQYHGNCKKCGSAMAILDMMLEGYDLICTRCGMREIVDLAFKVAPPCYQ